MEDYAGRILADRYRLPLPPSDEYELTETRAFDTRSGQEVLVRQVPLPEVVDAELLDGPQAVAVAGRGSAGRRPAGDLPAVRRAIAAAQAAASVPDHPRLDQVFDVFAEGGSLWIVSELVPARPLAALIADEPLSPYRAAEVAADVLTALRVLHAHGWTHRNITVRTVLICDDGRVVLTGLAAGAAEEALCGYDPVPDTVGSAGGSADAGEWGTPGGSAGSGLAVRGSVGPDASGAGAVDGFGPGSGAGWGGSERSGAVADGRHAGLGYDQEPGLDAGAGGDSGAGGFAPLVAPGYDTGPRYSDHIIPGRTEEQPDLKAATRAGAIAAYRAGAQAAAARVTEQRKAGADPAPEPRPEGSNLPEGYSYPYGGPDAHSVPAAARHGVTPRRPALPGPGPGPESEPESEAAPGSASEPPPARPALPAQLALPQGYRQAEDPDPAEHAGPGRPEAPDAAGYPRPGRVPVQPTPQGQPERGEVSVPAGHLRSEHAQLQPQAEGVILPSQAQARRQGAEASDAAGHVRAGRPEPRAQPDSRPGQVQPQPQASAPHDRWAGGPRTGLDAERARQTRMAVVGAVTERWAPEQAGPVHGHWQLAAPVGPSTDLWALGALLYRAVQGHAPYPEDSVSELVEMVCAEPPAFAEECGPLRPVVESLLRQDPTERPDFEELRGWLRSLVRSAPEPDAGFAVLPMPEPDPARLPVVRRRGELHGRHRNPAARAPRNLGRTLLVGVLALLAGVVAYAMLFMPRSPGHEEQDDIAKAPPKQTQTQTQKQPQPQSQKPTPQSPGASANTPTGTPQSKPAPQTAPPGFTIQQDPEHFEIAVPSGWERHGVNEVGQVRYTEGAFTLTIVPGRDKVDGNPDPLTYQKDKESELNAYRNSTWTTSGDIKSTTVGQQLRVTGRYTWHDANGRSVFARNFVVALGNSYHVVVVTGPEDEQDKVTEVFEQATGSYKAGG